MYKPKRSSQKHSFLAQSATSISSVLPLGVMAGVAIIVVAVFFSYFPCINGGFIFDDNLLLTLNKFIRASDGLYRYWFTTEAIDYWPVTNTSFWIEWRLWEMNPTGYHMTNLALHIIESLLIWIILHKLSIPGSFFAALIFAVHPVNVESVAWIAQRKNLMAMLFFLLSILWYVKSEGKKPGASAGAKHGNTTSLLPSINVWYGLSLLSFVLGMLSKGSVAMLPVLLLGIVWWLRPLNRWDLVRTAPFLLIAVVLTFVNVWFQTHGSQEVLRTAGFIERLLGAGSIVCFYLFKTLLPFNLIFFYPQWHIEVNNPLWWLPFLAVLGVSAVLFWYKKGWSRPLLFAWVFFCVALFPVLGFKDVYFMKYALVADHYQHLAICGIVALVAAVWSIWHERMRGTAHLTTISVAIVAVSALTLLTRHQSGLYRNAITLYQDTLEKNPTCWIAHNNLGQTLLEKGRLKEAIDHFQETLRLKPDSSHAHNNLGVALLDAGRLQEAIKHFEQALSFQPDDPDAFYNLGNAFKGAGQYQQAIEHYEQALKFNPDLPQAQNNLGVSLTKTGRLTEAIEHFEKALQLKPDFPDAYNNLSVILIQIGKPQEAIEYCKQALRLKTDYPEALYNMGNALVQTGRPQEAIKHYRHTLLLNPNFTEAYSNLAVAYAQTNQPAAAIAAAQKGLELAHSQRQATLSIQIENWLNSYRASLSDFQKLPSSPESASPPP